MNRTAAPLARSVSTTRNRRATSNAESAAVGSSITITLASSDKRLGDLDDLLLGDRQTARDPAGSSAHAEALQDLGRDLRVHRARVDPPPGAPRLAADEDVLRDRQVGEQRSAPGRSIATPASRAAAGLAGPRRARRCAAARVGQMHAGEDLDERRLAGAVFADERMDLAGAQVDRDVDQRLDRAE